MRGGFEMTSKLTLLNELLEIFVDLGGHVECLDQKTFLNDIFDTDFDNKAANRIMLNDRVKKPRLNLREQCKTPEIEEHIRKVTENKWGCDSYSLNYSLEKLVKNRSFLNGINGVGKTSLA